MLSVPENKRIERLRITVHIRPFKWRLLKQKLTRHLYDLFYLRLLIEPVATKRTVTPQKRYISSDKKGNTKCIKKHELARNSHRKLHDSSDEVGKIAQILFERTIEATKVKIISLILSKKVVTSSRKRTHFFNQTPC